MKCSLLLFQLTLTDTLHTLPLYNYKVRLKNMSKLRKKLRTSFQDLYEAPNFYEAVSADRGITDAQQPWGTQ